MGLHNSALNVVFKYSICVIDSVVIRGDVSAAEVIYIYIYIYIYVALNVTRVVIIRGYLRGWKEVVVADFRVLSSLGSTDHVHQDGWLPDRDLTGNSLIQVQNLVTNCPDHCHLDGPL
jgi:hypothetical protein